MPETPYLIHDAAKAPHIAGSGVLLVVKCLHGLLSVTGHQTVVRTPYGFNSGAVHLTGILPPFET